MYRTVIKGSELQGTAVLDIGEPVRDYARVSLSASQPRPLHAAHPSYSFGCARLGWAGLYKVYTCTNRRLDDVSRSIQIYGSECSFVVAGEGQGKRHPISLLGAQRCMRISTCRVLHQPTGAGVRPSQSPIASIFLLACGERGLSGTYCW